MRVFCLVMLAVSWGSLRAATIEGMDVAEQVTVAGRTLELNGAGVRTVRLGPFPIKAYVAAFYAPAKVASAEAAMASEGPLEFDFTFLHGVGQGQVTEAWNAQFAASVTEPYAGLAGDQARFVGMFGPLKAGGVERVQLVGDETRVFDGGVQKGTIAGREFQQAFLSLWFGAKPVEGSLKDALLCGGG